MAKFKLKTVFASTGRVDDCDTDDFRKLVILLRLALLADMKGVKEIVITNNEEIEKTKNEAGTFFRIDILNKDGSKELCAYPPLASKETLRGILDSGKRFGRIKSYKITDCTYEEYVKIETEKYGGPDE